MNNGTSTEGLFHIPPPQEYSAFSDLVREYQAKVAAALNISPELLREPVEDAVVLRVHALAKELESNPEEIISKSLDLMEQMVPQLHKKDRR